MKITDKTDTGTGSASKQAMRAAVTTTVNARTVKRAIVPVELNVIDKFRTETWARAFGLRIAAIAAAIGVLIGIGGMSVINLIDGNNQTIAGQTLGEVALTEAQLRKAVVRDKLTAYWAGPMDGALYSLIANQTGQVFVRYLPNGEGLNDSSAKYRVIATYPQADAYAVTQAAGNQANSISFVNSDGGQVFYSKSFSANVYVAYADKPFEIEVFDPGAGIALGLATTAGQLQLIK